MNSLQLLDSFRLHTKLQHTCHDLPTLTVTKDSLPSRCTEYGTLSVM